MDSVGVVIATFNRIDKLKIALTAYASQTLLPKYIIVVDNNSSDGTFDYLEEWVKVDEGFKKIVKHLPINSGGSGGFYEGEKIALTENADWIMIADDDAYPEKNYIWGMMDYIEKHDKDQYSIICGKVLQNGKYVHRCFHNKNKFSSRFLVDAGDSPRLKVLYEDDDFDFDFASYVGILINKDKLKKAGLVKKEYFIWHDDTEHSIRLKREGRIVCIPAYTITHDIEKVDSGLSWKVYYGYRNLLDIYIKYYQAYAPLFILLCFIKALLCPLKGKSLEEVKLRLIAIKDALNGRTGVNEKYKPGWIPGKKNT